MTNYLTKDEWDKLDTLLGKHGFGGYYDLLECLKSLAGKNHAEINQLKTLPEVVTFLMALNNIEHKV